MKKRLILLLIPVLVTLYGFDSKGSWLIDRGSFHVSVHGQTSCLDCHEEITERDLHPDPANVTKSVDALFNHEMCLDCHDDVIESIEGLQYGNRKVKDPEEYKDCLECHNPHEQVSSEVADGKFDPSINPLEHCGKCHEEQKSLPSLGVQEESCMECHGLSVTAGTSKQREAKTMCLYCHAHGGTRAQEMTGLRVPLIHPAQYEKTPHSDMDCVECHMDAAGFEHDHQEIRGCRECHLPHDEKVAHDAHFSVSCEACHLQGMSPFRDNETGRIEGKITLDPGKPLDLHNMIWPDHDQCLRCHYSGNPIGASSGILPPKSFLCMPCHTSTFSIRDIPSRIGLVVFIVGMMLVMSTWLTGTLPGKPKAGLMEKLFGIGAIVLRTIFSARILSVIRTLFFDVLLQRRLFMRSKARWFIHALIFYPFVFRLFWGLVALIGSLLSPESAWVWPMLDKNHPVTALFFEVSGILLLLGIISTFIRGRYNQTDLAGIPRQDIPALIIIAFTVLLGFVLEGMRLAMTGHPESGLYAPAGLFISRLFSDPSGLVDIYSYFWYAHAGFNAIFIAYLPFSRLLHIILAPIVLVMGAASKHGNGG